MCETPLPEARSPGSSPESSGGGGGAGEPPDFAWPAAAAAALSASPTAAAANPSPINGGDGGGGGGDSEDGNLLTWAARSGASDGGPALQSGTLTVLPLRVGDGGAAQTASAAQPGADRL